MTCNLRSRRWRSRGHYVLEIRLIIISVYLYIFPRPLTPSHCHVTDFFPLAWSWPCDTTCRRVHVWHRSVSGDTNLSRDKLMRINAFRYELNSESCRWTPSRLFSKSDWLNSSIFDWIHASSSSTSWLYLLIFESMSIAESKIFPIRFDSIPFFAYACSKLCYYIIMTSLLRNVDVILSISCSLK